MQYEWEKKVPKGVWAGAQGPIGSSPYTVIGIAVENENTGEAALLVHPMCPTGGVLMADLWKDVYGDAQRIYGDAVEAIYPSDEATKSDAPDEVLIITDKMLAAGVSAAARGDLVSVPSLAVMEIFMAMINEYEGEGLFFGLSDDGPFFKAKTAERMI